MPRWSRTSTPRSPGTWKSNWPTSNTTKGSEHLAFEFKFPDVGEGIHEGEIVDWLVEEGDTVEADEDIVEVMTDKATVQISAPVAGTIQEIRFQQGETVTVGDVFVLIAAGGGEGEPAVADAPAGQTPDPEPVEQAGEAAARPVTPKRTNGGPSGEVITTRTPDGVLAPPSVRIEARKQGIDISQVEGSGPAGRVSLADLEAHAPAAEPARPASPGRGDSRSFSLPSVSREHATSIEPIRADARSPRASAHRSMTLQPHFTHALTVQADALVGAVERVQPLAAQHDVQIDDQVLAVKAVAHALGKHRRVNAHVDEESRDLIIEEPIHVAVTVPTDDGLRLHTVPDADERSLVEIARHIEQGDPDTVEPGFTITTLGPFGGVVCTPVLVHPQVAGMVLGSLRDVGALEDGEIVPAKELTLSFSFDHRYVDGYDGALFAEDVAKLLLDPGSLLLDDL